MRLISNLKMASSNYAQYQKVLKNAVRGQVVTRFPPEPSGYLHVGHVKAAMLNYHYAKIYEGRMLLRFDDTNPTRENADFANSITTDLASLEIVPDGVSHTSDHFPRFFEFAVKVINDGKAYMDNTPVELMRE
jgi:glutamyl-tRNA synthetase